MALLNFGQVNFPMRGVLSDRSLHFRLFGLFVPATIHIPEEIVRARAESTRWTAPRCTAPDKNFFITNCWNSVPVHWNWLLSCMEFIQDDFSIPDFPSLELLVGDSRAMFVIVEARLLGWYLHADRLKVQALIECRAQLGVIGMVTDATRAMIAAAESVYGRIFAWRLIRRRPMSLLLFWS